jgi:hypothetical protein
VHVQYPGLDTLFDQVVGRLQRGGDHQPAGDKGHIITVAELVGPILPAWSSR